MYKFLVAALAAFALLGCQVQAQTMQGQVGAPPKGLEQAVFAGGCFWCAEHDFENIPGVQEVISGYTGGTLKNPTYEDVVTETTGHYESVVVRYDPGVISYRQLVDRYWMLVDPTDAGGQFCDRGPSYRTGIFVADAAQRKTAEESKAALIASGQLKQKVVTQILPLGPFYAAEDYHQDYSAKNPLRYNFYRSGCGRDARLKEVWGKAPNS